MPITGSQPALMPARVGLMRLGASRLGYYQPLPFVSINGASERVRVEGFTIRDILDGTPNTLTLRVDGFTPVQGQEILFGLGSADPYEREFGGHILNVTQVYEADKPANIAFDLSCISYEWLLNHRKVTGKWMSESASTIFADILSGWTSGFTAGGVQAGLPSLDEFTATNEDVTTCFDRICKRIGSDWKLIHKDLTVPASAGEAVHAITDSDVHTMTGIAVTVDLSQVRTRQSGEGGGANATAQVPAGTTTIPIEDSTWYPGGTVVSGPQTMTYTGVTIGGGGALVGALLSPTNAPAVALRIGSGLSSGDYNYAATYYDGTGETTPGPLSSGVTFGGTVTAPTAPSAAKVSGGNLSAGDYNWKTTFVDSAGGETTPSAPSSGITMDAVPAPTSALTGTKVSSNGNLSAGDYNYKTTYVDANGGETTPSAASATVTLDEVTAPAGLTSWTPLAGGSLVDNGLYNHLCTYVTAAGETTTSGQTGGNLGAGNTAVNVGLPISSDPAVTARRLYRTVAGGGGAHKLVATINDNTTTGYVDNVADGSLGADAPGSNTAVFRRINVTNIPTSPNSVASRKLYRTVSGGSTYKFLATIANNTTTTYSDNTADGFLGADAPSSNTAVFRSANITNIQVSADPNVVSRKLYRCVANGSVFKLVTTIANNTATTYADNTADGSLGADAPSTSTAFYKQASLTGIPIGPTGTTGRYVYRTLANGSQLKLLTTIANNSTTTYTDSTADGSLGANAPTSNTSGLTSPTGIVLAGSTSILVTGLGPFEDAGGWAMAGGQSILYSGKSASSLTGVPASGPGSLASTLNYGTEIVASSMLIGVPASGPGSIQYDILSGDPVNVFVTRDDLTAQAAMAVALTTPTHTHDGIIEGDLIQDRRMSLTEITARCDAKLVEVKDPIVSVRYETRDKTTQSGREVTISLGAPTNISGTFKIQSVTIGDFDGTGRTWPRRQVEASSRRFTFEALLRLIKAA